MDKSIYESLKEIEDRLEGEEYSGGGVSFYLEVSKLDFDISDNEALKKLFINYGVIDESYDVSLTSVIDKESDLFRFLKYKDELILLEFFICD